ncbi:MAG: VTT domain-containing protein [Polyangiales bacterium]
MALPELIHQILKPDVFLKHVLDVYGTQTYIVLFAIVFCETGLIVLPFLPGDSLLFTVGVFASRGWLSLPTAFALMMGAAFLGDNVNYNVGKFLGPTLHAKGKLPFVKQAHLDKTHAFYEKHGRRALILARFVPIVRTFAPFVAGVGSMSYPRFIGASVLGTLLWTTICLGAGYTLAEVEFVKKHFEIVVLAIVFISVLPMILTIWKERGAAKAAASAS